MCACCLPPRLTQPDVDYGVFSGGARRVLAHGSPYADPAYKYTPLLAWIMAPSVLLLPEFGKLLFAAADVCCAALVSHLLPAATPAPLRRQAVALVAWNPIVAVVSTRGSCESLLVGLPLLGMLVLARAESVVALAALHALAVQLRLFPVILLPLMLAHVARPRHRTAWRPRPALLYAAVFAAVLGASLAACTALYVAAHQSRIH